MTKSKRNEETAVEVISAGEVVNNADYERFQQLDKRIDTAIHTSESAMMSIMGALAVIHEKKLYITEGYKSVKEYMTDRHGMEIKKTALSEAVNTFRRFGDMESGLLKDDYLLYTYSQLKLMQRLPDSELEKVTPEMSCRKIQELINSLKAVEEKSEEQKEEKEDIAKNQNVSRETSVEEKIEESGHVEPYVEWTYTMTEFAEMDGETFKTLILEQFKQGRKVILNYRYE